jgi:hypothetical protein
LYALTKQSDAIPGLGAVSSPPVQGFPTSMRENIMTENRNDFARLAKGLFVGGLLGVAAAVLYAARRGMGLRGDISKEGVRVTIRDRPLPSIRDETIMETGKRVGPAIGWSVVFILASAVAMVSNFKMKNN